MSAPFVVRVSESPASAHPRAGVTVSFEDQEDRFSDFGINIQMLQPREPSAMYHSESVQASVLVLGGTPKVTLNDEMLVGGGDGPSWI